MAEIIRFTKLVTGSLVSNELNKAYIFDLTGNLE